MDTTSCELCLLPISSSHHITLIGVNRWRAYCGGPAGPESPFVNQQILRLVAEGMPV